MQVCVTYKGAENSGFFEDRSGFCVFILFFVAIGRWPREGFKSWVRPKALKVWGKPFRLVASRVSFVLCRWPALLGAGPGLSLVTSDRKIPSKAVVNYVLVV